MRLALILVAPFLLSPAAAQSSLTGKVVNFLTGVPVRNARVRLSGGAEVHSDAAGAFSFSGLEAGQYAVVADKDGFDENASMVLVDVPGPHREVVIRLTPLATILGRVADTDGEAMGRVVVVALRSDLAHGWRSWEPAGKAVTDDRGQYHIPWLRAGQYLVQAAGYDEHAFLGEPEAAPKTHDTFVPVYFGGARDRASAPPLALAAGGQAHADFSLTMETGHRITGRLTNLKPVTQPALQLLSGDDDFGFNRSALNPLTGYFELHNVLDGAYRLRVMGVDAGDQPLVAEQEVRVAGQDVAGLSLALGPGLTLKGRMRLDAPAGQTGEPAEQAALLKSFVQLYGAEGFTLSSLPSPDGALEIPSVIRGRYRVGFAVAQPLYVSSARFGNADLLANPELAIGAEAANEIEIVLRADGGSIFGTLAPAAMREGVVCLVLVAESLGRPPASMCTGDGSFGFRGVAPGSYRVHAFSGRVEVEYNAPRVMRALAGSGTRIEVRPSALTSVQIQTLSEAPE